MARERFDVEVPDGQHLGFSRDTDGAYRAHLFDNETNGLVGHAELFKADDNHMDAPNPPYDYYPDFGTSESRELTPEEAEAIDALIRLGIVLAALAVKAAAPHVARWWQVAIPAMKLAGDNALLTVKSVGSSTIQSMQSGWSRISNARGVASEPASQDKVFAVDTTGPSSSAELALAFQNCRARMSSAEARSRFVAALVARAFSDEQFRMLRDVQIDDDARIGLRTGTQLPSSEQVGQSITWMLERNQSLLEPESLAELTTVFGSRDIGQVVRLRIEETKGSSA